MPSIIVDSSVAIKWYFRTDEDGLEEAQEILSLIESGQFELVAPRIIFLELADSVKFSKKEGEEKCLEVLSLFGNVVNEFTDLPTIELIVQKSYSGNIASYDAAFVALAEQLDIPLFTADYKHHKKSISKNIVWLKEWKGKL